jgi:hypothetical protein
MKLQAAKKGSSIILLALLAASIFLLPQSTAAKNSPSTPEVISAKFVDCSYEMAPVYGTDQYTGETVVKLDGYNVDNRSIAITIRNQPYTSSYLDGNSTNLFFNFRIKGQYGTDANWDYYPFAEDGQSTNTYGGTFVPLSERPPAPAFSQSTDQSTTITFTIPGVYRISDGTTLDVQVQALDGYMYYWDRQYHFVGQSSGWSDTKTVTIGASSPQSTVTRAPTPTPSPTVTPSQVPITPTEAPYSTINPTAEATQSGTSQAFTIGFDWQTVVIVVLVIAVVLLAIVVLLQRKGNNVRRIS